MASLSADGLRSPGTRLGDDEAIAALEEAADRLFYRHGVVGVTVASVRDESGLSMRRLYGLCPSKADLVSRWLRHRHVTWMQMFTDRVDEGLASGADPVDAVFDAIEAWLVDTNFRGCGFLNTHAESSELSREHVEIIQDHKRSLAAYLDQVTGSGDSVVLIVDGAIVHASIYRNVGPVENARKTIRMLVANQAGKDAND